MTLIKRMWNNMVLLTINMVLLTITRSISTDPGSSVGRVSASGNGR